MFSVAPKEVQLTMVPKKGRKNKEIALEHFNNSITKIATSVTDIENIIKLQDPTVIEMRKHLRNVLREVKDIRNSLTKYKNIQYKPKRSRGSSNNTGLSQLLPISEDMALFFTSFIPVLKQEKNEKIKIEDWEYGVTQKSRNDVTNVLCAYIKINELYDSDNKTIIMPDAALKKLLKVEDDVELKYWTMQKYLKNCFEKVNIEEDNSDEKENKRGRKPKESIKVVEESKVKKPIKKEKETKLKKEPKSKK